MKRSAEELETVITWNASGEPAGLSTWDPIVARRLQAVGLTLTKSGESWECEFPSWWVKLALPGKTSARLGRRHSCDLDPRMTPAQGVPSIWQDKHDPDCKEDPQPQEPPSGAPPKNPRTQEPI